MIAFQLKAGQPRTVCI